jgi:hypothetical protein
METKGNQAWRVAVKHEIKGYIREISQRFGGDEPEWLDSYIAEVHEMWKDDLKKAQECFLSIVKQARVIRPHGYGKPMGQAR